MCGRERDGQGAVRREGNLYLAPLPLLFCYEGVRVGGGAIAVCLGKVGWWVDVVFTAPRLLSCFLRLP